MNPIRLYDAGPALIATITANAHGGKKTPADFMPYYKKDDEAEVVSGEDFFEALSKMKGVRDGRLSR